MLKLKNPLVLVLIGSLAMMLATVPVTSAPAKTINPDIAPKDLGVINEERIIYWLIKRGELSADATEQQKRAAIEAYIGSRVEPPMSIEEIEKQALAIKNATRHSHQLKVARERKKAALSNQLQSKTNAQSVEESVTKKVNVLAIAIDFPDLPHDDNRLTSSDTGMYYNDYSIEHYQQLMFADETYPGPQGQALQSARNYYTQESGGSFDFNGKVYGWVTADNNAAFYGGSGNGANDANPRQLIREALTKAVAKYNINLADYDLDDRWDLDGDGNINEPDGYIDHIMIFHSSMGEDAGGGVLGSDAIWSHRWVVSPYYDIPGTYFEQGNRGYRPWGYTIVPIDAAIGVVSHEFGHDLGLADEYDTNNSVPGSPVADWSIMASGSWVGQIPGSQPVTFGAYARSKLQDWYGGNWVNETKLTLVDLQGGKTFELVDAVNHEGGLNQIKVEIPRSILFRQAPYSGDYQYYSNAGDNLNNRMDFSLTIPEGQNHQLVMQAFWDIEVDWDYAQVLINGQSVAGNLTKARNPLIDSYPDQSQYDISHYLTGKSDSWVALTFDVSEYAGQTVEVSIKYYTDGNTGGYGLFVDDIALLSEASNQYHDGAELEGMANLTGFSRIEALEKLSAQEYYHIQLRSHQGNDSGLSSRRYDPGVVMWFADSGQSNNQSSVHPGRGFASVIDADQNLIQDDYYGIWWTRNQIRDAAFSLYPQQPKAADNHLEPISDFNDIFDYSTPQQPASGVSLPIHGLSMQLLQQANDSSSATIHLNYQAPALTPRFSYQINDWKVTFNNNSYGGNGWKTYQWDFGDGEISHAASPTHQFAMGGLHTIKLTAIDQDGNAVTIFEQIQLAGPAFTLTKQNLTIFLTDTSSQLSTKAVYAWDFGDGVGQSSEQSPTYTYAEPGTYLIKLTTTDGDKSQTAQMMVTVTNPPVASFTYEVKGLTVVFTDTSQYGAGELQYHWDFGEKVKQIRRRGKKPKRPNATSNLQSPIHTYRDDEYFKVILTVTDQEGRSDTTAMWINLDDVDNDDNEDERDDD
ncbi:immune inhibitor A domain-containing protein [Aliikangiella maris]|uniref:Immune inhibitor A domain-containing protein n=2 Tax=Aliikangiella maris TaxID=3162458 RepID=A0ABV2C0S7_9GAMM